MNLKFKKEKFFFGINNSLLKNSWIKSKPDTRLSLNISQKYSLTNNIANILALRINDINQIKNFLDLKTKNIEFVVLLMANAPTISGKLIDKGISILRKNKKADSAVTTSIYNMWSPLRARKLTKQKLLKTELRGAERRQKKIVGVEPKI